MGQFLGRNIEKHVESPRATESRAERAEVRLDVSRVGEECESKDPLARSKLRINRGGPLEAPSKDYRLSDRRGGGEEWGGKAPPDRFRLQLGRFQDQ